MQPPSPRSYLFVPANRPERFEKACLAGADAVLLDLEDAVPAGDKVNGREAIAAWARAGQPVFVRINGAGTEWFRDDAELARLPGIAGIVLPKAERVDDVLFLARHAGAASVLPLIETAQGFANAQALAQAHSVSRLLFGSIDFQLDLGIGVDDAELSYFRSHLVLVSRRAGAQPPVDGVTTSIDDLELVRAETRRARRSGFGGKLCIHPKQIATVHECFRPTEAEITWARRVLEAAGAAKGSAVALDGRMIDRPLVRRAETIIAQSSLR